MRDVPIIPELRLRERWFGNLDGSPDQPGTPGSLGGCVHARIYSAKQKRCSALVLMPLCLCAIFHALCTGTTLSGMAMQ